MATNRHCGQPSPRIVGGHPRATPQQQRRVERTLAAAEWRLVSNIGGSNCQPKSRTISNPGVLCEVISVDIFQGVRLEVPSGWVPLRTPGAAETPTTRRISPQLGWTSVSLAPVGEFVSGVPKAAFD